MSDDEPYRQIRIYRSKGLCDCWGRPLTFDQLLALQRLAESQGATWNANNLLERAFEFAPTSVHPAGDANG